MKRKRSVAELKRLLIEGEPGMFAPVVSLFLDLAEPPLDGGGLWGTPTTNSTVDDFVDRVLAEVTKDKVLMRAWCAVEEGGLAHCALALEGGHAGVVIWFEDPGVGLVAVDGQCYMRFRPVPVVPGQVPSSN